MNRNRNRNRVGAPVIAAMQAAGLITDNLTGRYVSSVFADFTLSGAAVDDWKDHGGNADLDVDYLAGTKANRDTTHPLNSSDPTVDTNNAFCEYQSPAAGTLADLWPAGTGTLYMVLYADSHPDAFGDLDWIYQFGANLKIGIHDGPTLKVATNSETQVLTPAIALDQWHVIAIRNAAGAGGLRVRINDSEVNATGAAVATLTNRIKRFADSGGGGRFDGAIGDDLWYSAVHTDDEVEQNIAALRALYAEL